MISKGMLGRARQMAARNLRALEPYVAAGKLILGLEPSCVLTFRDEYLEFFPKHEGASRLATQSMLIEEYLTRPGPGGLRPLERVRGLGSASGTCAVHGHCYTKALVGPSPMLDMLRLAGWQAQEIEAGCCGMAGSFGYEAEHLELSLQIAESRLLPAVRRASEAGQQVCAAGMSCRTQIADGTGIKPWHPIQAVAAAITPAGSC
jgi:Fe-S oxidoreductase